MASSSSISPVKYEVYISFRGQDVRSGFLSHLRKALVEEKIQTFVDDQLIRGEEIESLLQIMERCAISVVIFSENYAESPWCLDELVKILEGKERKGQIVIPVFYRVSPRDVQDLTGNFGRAIFEHKKHFDIWKVKNWRQALKETSLLLGFDSQEYEAESLLVDEIVRYVQKRLYRLFLNVKYEVFISFRGTPIRFGFLSHIHKAFVKRRIRTSLYEIERGEEISSHSEIIETCAISVVIFSKNYANSPRCLDELVKILECKKTMGQIVIPVFYLVKPDDVQELSGSFGKAISEHKKDIKLSHKVENWCQALKETGFLSGFASQGYPSESILVDKIVEHVQNELNHLFVNEGDVKEDKNTISSGERNDNMAKRIDSKIDDDEDDDEDEDDDDEDEDDEDDIAEKTDSKIDLNQLLDQNFHDLTVTARRYIGRLSRHGKISICLLAYVAIATTWPLVSSSLRLFIKKKAQHHS